MPGPGGVEVGRASVRVLPDTSAFARSLERYLDRMERRLRIEIPTQVNAAGIDRDVRTIAQQLEKSTKAEIPVELQNEQQVKREFDRIVQRLSGKTAEITVSASRSTAGVLSDFGRISNSIGATTLKVGALIGALGGAGAAAAGLAGAVATASGAVALIPAAGIAAAAAINTVKIGLVGFSDALKEMDDPTKFAEALKKLSPAARETAVAFRDLNPRVEDFRKHVQENLFKGLADQIRTLADNYLPKLKTGFGDIAQALNTSARGVGDFLNSSRAINDVESIFNQLRRTMGQLVEAPAALTRAFLDLAVVGSEFLPGLAHGFTAATQRFAAFLIAARQTGQLQDVIQNALTAIRQLGDVLQNVGAIFKGVFSAANAAGGGFLNLLVEITDSLRTFVESAEGISVLQNFFSGVAALAKALLLILGEIGEVVAQVVGPAFLALATVVADALGSLASAVKPLGEAIAALAPVLGTAAKAVAGLVTALVDALSPVVIALAPSIERLVEVLGGGLSGVFNALAPVLLQVAERLAPLIELFANFLASALTSITPLLVAIIETGFKVLLSVLETLAPALPLVADALAKIAAVISGALQESGPVLTQIATAIGELIVAALNNVLPLLPSLVQALLALLAAALPLIPPLLRLAQEVIPLLINQAVTQFFIDLAHAVTDLLNAITPLISILIDVLIPVFKVLVAVVSSAWDTISGIISGALSIITGYIKAFIGFFTGDWTTLWNGIQNIASGAWGIVHSIMSQGVNQVLSIIRAIGGPIGDAARSAFEAVKDAFRSGIDTVVGLVRDLPSRAASALGNIGRTLFDAGKSFISGFIDGIKSMISSVASAASSVVSAVRDFFPFSPAKKGPLSGRGYTSYSGIALARDFAKSMESGVPLVTAAADKLLGSARLTTSSGVGVSSGFTARGDVAITQNIYPQPTQSEESIGMAASRALALALRTG